MTSTQRKIFTSYSGIALPLKLVGEIDQSTLQHRNTYYVGEFDDAGLLLTCQRIVYGEVDLEHRYQYRANGTLLQAEICNDDGEFEVLQFNEQGRPVKH